MDAAKLILRQPVSNPQKLNNAENPENLSQQRKKELAKEFESVLMEKLMTQMKKTTGCLSEKDSAADEQIKDLFWSQPGKGLSDQGGLGLWKDVYQFLSETGTSDNAASVDKSV